MSSSQQKPWSDNPNAPKISHRVYSQEKAYFAGALIGAILYGTRKTRPPTRPPTCAYFLVYPRGRHCDVLPMYGRVVEPSLSQKGGRQVGGHLLHVGHILVRDRVYRDEPPP